MYAALKDSDSLLSLKSYHTTNFRNLDTEWYFYLFQTIINKSPMISSFLNYHTMRFQYHWPTSSSSLAAHQCIKQRLEHFLACQKSQTAWCFPSFLLFTVLIPERNIKTPCHQNTTSIHLHMQKEHGWDCTRLSLELQPCKIELCSQASTQWRIESTTKL